MRSRCTLCGQPRCEGLRIQSLQCCHRRRMLGIRSDVWLRNMRNRCPLCGNHAQGFAHPAFAVPPRPRTLGWQSELRLHSMRGRCPLCEQSRVDGLLIQHLQGGQGRNCCGANPQCDSRTCAAAAHYVDNPATEVCASGPRSAATAGECWGSGPTCASTTCAADAHMWTIMLRRFMHPAPAVPPRAENAVRPIRSVTP